MTTDWTGLLFEALPATLAPSIDQVDPPQVSIAFVAMKSYELQELGELAGSHGFEECRLEGGRLVFSS